MKFYPVFSEKPLFFKGKCVKIIDKFLHYVIVVFAVYCRFTGNTFASVHAGFPAKIQ